MGAVKINDGTILLPGLSFSADGNTGFYRIGADNIGLSLGGVKALDVTATVFLFTGANSTSNSALTVENTSNAAAASHAYIEAKVGGTTSTGDPQLRLTIPSGTSWYIAPDNSAGDVLTIGTGTTVGSNGVLILDTNADPTDDYRVAILGGTVTLADGAGATHNQVRVNAQTITLAGTTQVTTLEEFIKIHSATIAQSGGAVTMDAATGLGVLPPITGASVTLTDSAGIRVRNPAANSGTQPNLAGIHIEGLTRGGTQNVQIQMANGGTEPTAAVANTTGLYSVDVGAATVLGIVAETAVVTSANFTLNRKIIIRYNNASYALAATTTLTAE